MRAEFRVFTVDPLSISNPAQAGWLDDIEESEVVEHRIDTEKSTGINYYKIEGRIASFSVLGNEVVEEMLRNRNSYIHPISLEITRIAVKLINNNDEELFFGILGFQYRLDGFSDIITDLKAYDIIYFLIKYYMPYQDKLVVFSNTSYNVRTLFSYLLGFSSGYIGAKRAIDTFIPQTGISYLYDVNESGVFGQPVTNLFLFTVADVYTRETGEGTYSPNDEILIDITGSYTERIISYGKDSIGGINYLTFLYYFAQSIRYDDPAGGSYDIEKETLRLKRYKIQSGGTLLLTENRNISNDFLSAPNLYDIYFDGRYIRQQDNLINILDDIYNITDYNTEEGYPAWDVLFTGTIAQENLYFNNPQGGETISNIDISADSALSSLLLLNNLYISPPIPYYSIWSFAISLRNKLSNELGSPVVYLNETNCRTEYFQGHASIFDSSKLDIFIISESLKSSIKSYYDGLFYKYKTKRTFIFPKELIYGNITVSSTISYNGKTYSIYELDRNYQNGFYKATCYGEE